MNNQNLVSPAKLTKFFYRLISTVFFFISLSQNSFGLDVVREQIITECRQVAIQSGSSPGYFGSNVGARWRSEPSDRKALQLGVQKHMMEALRQTNLELRQGAKKCFEEKTSDCKETIEGLRLSLEAGRGIIKDCDKLDKINFGQSVYAGHFKKCNGSSSEIECEFFDLATASLAKDDQYHLGQELECSNFRQKFGNQLPNIGMNIQRNVNFKLKEECKKAIARLKEENPLLSHIPKEGTLDDLAIKNSIDKLIEKNEDFLQRVSNMGPSGSVGSVVTNPTFDNFANQYHDTMKNFMNYSPVVQSYLSQLKEKNPEEYVKSCRAYMSTAATQSRRDLGYAVGTAVVMLPCGIGGPKTYAACYIAATVGTAGYPAYALGVSDREAAIYDSNGEKYRPVSKSKSDEVLFGAAIEIGAMGMFGLSHIRRGGRILDLEHKVAQGIENGVRSGTEKLGIKLCQSPECHKRLETAAEYIGRKAGHGLAAEGGFLARKKITGEPIKGYQGREVAPSGPDDGLNGVKLGKKLNECYGQTGTTTVAAAQEKQTR